MRILRPGLHPLPANLRRRLRHRVALQLALCGIAASRARARMRNSQLILRPLARVHARTWRVPADAAMPTSAMRGAGFVIRVPASLPAACRAMPQTARARARGIFNFGFSKKKEEGALDD